jgi:DNA-binding NarL/FixJ family response regulator
MPGIDGLEVARSLQGCRVSTELIVLTGHKNEDIFDLAMQLGIKGYVLKDSAVADIVSCIETVLQGRHYISPRFSECLFRRANRHAPMPEQRRPLDALTAAEQRILKLLADTKTNKEIANELFISRRTVETHRRNICEKLNLHGVHRLLQFAFEQRSALATLSSFPREHSRYRRVA